MVEARHVLRYGTAADHQIMLLAADTYDCIAINANSAAYSASSIAQFVTKLIAKEKSYFIDPITYAFQDSEKIEFLCSKLSAEEKRAGIKHIEKPIKKSFDKLVEFYGTPSTVIRNKKAIEVAVFSNEDLLKTFCNNVLEFELHGMRNELEKSDDIKYLRYDSSFDEKAEPTLLIAPYFYLEADKYQQWLDVNISCINQSIAFSRRLESEKSVYAEMVLDKKLLLNRGALERIADAYKSVACEGYMIWIDGFDETLAVTEELKGYIYLLQLLHGKPVFNMYGGYFSVMLMNSEIELLHGVSHGLEYGENRAVFPAGGGIPSSKYYYRLLHQRLKFEDAFTILVDIGIIQLDELDWGSPKKYFRDICQCSQCQKIIRKGMIDFNRYRSDVPYDIQYKDHVSRRVRADQDTKDNCRLHYLLCKHQEYEFVLKKSKQELFCNLQEVYEKYVQLVDNRMINHLSNWVDVMKTT